MSAMLAIRKLNVSFGAVRSVRDVTLDVSAGSTLAIIGESGAGKSTLLGAIAGLVPNGGDVAGSIQFAGTEIVDAPEATIAKLRGARIGVALQGAPANPVTTVRSHLLEMVGRDADGRRSVSVRRLARQTDTVERLDALAEEVDLAPKLLDRFPHELSGGQRQRVALAAALVRNPDLLLLDEPTAGLDAPSAERVAATLTRIVQQRGLALITVTHDVEVAHQLADRAAVMYAGQILEVGATPSVLAEPAHPYTWALARATPALAQTQELRPIRGLPPEPSMPAPGCPFAPRCTQADERCDEPVTLQTVGDRELACHHGGRQVVLSAGGLSMRYADAGDGHHALNGVELDLFHGEALGVTGPSGSGKSTLARILCADIVGFQGSVSYHADLAGPLDVSGVEFMRQDPWDAVSPLFSVAEVVGEPLAIRKVARARQAELVSRTLSEVGLRPDPSLLARRAHDLSGGQLQRVCLARVLITRPRILVADEPTSRLDPSEQARLLLLLRERQVEQGLALIVISHDRRVLAKVTDRTIVLEAGRVVEVGSTAAVLSSSYDQFTRRLIRCHTAATAKATVEPGGSHGK